MLNKLCARPLARSTCYRKTRSVIGCIQATVVALANTMRSKIATLQRCLAPNRQICRLKSPETSKASEMRKLKAQGQ